MRRGNPASTICALSLGSPTASIPPRFPQLKRDKIPLVPGRSEDHALDLRKVDRFNVIQPIVSSIFMNVEFDEYGIFMNFLDQIYEE